MVWWQLVRVFKVFLYFGWNILTKVRVAGVHFNMVRIDFLEMDRHRPAPPTPSSTTLPPFAVYYSVMVLKNPKHSEKIIVL